MISPSNTYPGLTVSRPVLPAPDGYRGEPGLYYPTGGRNYARVVARDDLPSAGLAMLAKQLRLRRVYVLEDGHPISRILYAQSFRRAARRLGVPIAGSTRYDPTAEGFAPLAEKVARSGADGVLLGGSVFDGGDRVVKALRARLGRRLEIMVGDITFLPVRFALDLAGPAAHGVYVASTDIEGGQGSLRTSSRRFLRDFVGGEFATPQQYVNHAADATELVLNAIARSDGTRASVLDEIRKTRVRNGLLGDYRLDRNGDITPAPVLILRMTGRRRLEAPLSDALDGAAIDRLLHVPAGLTR
jgi:branched-chain amino acid transport system substrate-binding protein